MSASEPDASAKYRVFEQNSLFNVFIWIVLACRKGGARVGRATGRKITDCPNPVYVMFELAVSAVFR